MQQTTELRKSLSYTGLITLIGMSAFEGTKQFVYPEITIWQSHVVTIIFSGIVGTIATFFVLRRYLVLQHQLIVEATDRTQMEERNRMAREIHDTLAQGFTGIVVQLEAAEDVLPGDPREAQAHIVTARTLARESLIEARRSVWALCSQALEQSDLVTALTRVVNQCAVGMPTQVNFFLSGTPCLLPPPVEHHLLRITQEALNNALRHAQASTIAVALTFHAHHVYLLIHDNGHGFDPLHRTDRGFGLTSMWERAANINARLAVTSQPGQGTKLSVIVPVPAHTPVGVSHEQAHTNSHPDRG